jgi:hypothetical protein
MCCTTSSAHGRATTVRAGRLAWGAPGRAQRSPGRRPAGAAFAANAAARDVTGAAREAAHATGQSAAMGHVAAHELGAAAYAIRAVWAASSEGERDGARSSRVPVAARPVARPYPGARARRPAATQRAVLVRVRLLSGSLETRPARPSQRLRRSRASLRPPGVRRADPCRGRGPCRLPGGPGRRRSSPRTRPG